MIKGILLSLCLFEFLNLFLKNRNPIIILANTIRINNTYSVIFNASELLLSLVVSDVGKIGG